MAPSANKALVDKALGLCRTRPEGATQEDFQDELKITDQVCTDLVNELMREGRVGLHMRGSTYVYKLIDPAQAAKHKGLHLEDKLVLQAIEKSGRQGIWTKDMKRETNLPPTRITKILKTLEGRQLIKSVQSVNDGKRKIYVLFGVEPAAELTGGLWFADADMDMEFIGVMQDFCKKVLRGMGEATVSEILEKFEGAKVANVQLDLSSIQTLINTLRARGEIEAVPANPASWRIARQQIPERVAFTARPCGVCPVIEQCQPGGKISPETCVYFESYLKW